MNLIKRLTFVLLNYSEIANMSKEMDRLWTTYTTIYIVILDKIYKLKLIQTTHWNYDVINVKIMKHSAQELALYMGHLYLLKQQGK